MTAEQGQGVAATVAEPVQQRAQQRRQHRERQHGHGQVERDPGPSLAHGHLEEHGVGQRQQHQGVPGRRGRVQQVLKAAMALVGTPYRWGGTSTEGFDCSGLVGYVFRNALGIELPRVSREMAAKADAELIRDRSQLTPGDLVFFGLRGRVNHVGIYVGDGQFLHAPSRGKDVRVDRMDTGYWGNRFLQARRVEI